MHDVLRSPGQPLEPGVRGEMEARFGHDFSRVRVHTDRRAAESARAVSAAAYTVGRDVVFGTARYAPATGEGRELLAHELVHTMQQGPAPATGPLPVEPAASFAEAEAERAVSGVALSYSTQPASVQRRVVVNPPAASAQIESHLGTLCPVTFSHTAAGQIDASGCGVVAPSESCTCVCDAIGDASRTYTVNVDKAAISKKTQTLAGGTSALVPETSVAPTTASGPNPTIQFLDTGSDAEFGAFSSGGGPIWAPLWRILGHELCGHARLGQTYGGGPGNRPGHDVTIDTENAIAKEHGGPPRGHFADKPRQGESFFNPVGDRSKVVFSLTDGLHYEAP